MVQYTAQVVDPAGSAVRDLPVLFGSSRRMQLSLGIQGDGTGIRLADVYNNGTLEYYVL